LLSNGDAFGRITLIDANPESVYCGSIPENISDGNSHSKLPAPQWKIDLQELCNSHNNHLQDKDKLLFIQGNVTDINLDERWIQVSKQNTVEYVHVLYDVLSIDIGSKSKCISSIPGASRYVIPTRPMTNLMKRLEEIEENLERPNNIGEEHRTIAVVGGGSSGIELALSITGRLRPLLESHSLQVRLITSDQILLPEIPYARKRLKDLLADRGIIMMFHSAVCRVEDNALFLDSGMKVPFSYCFWATGAAPHDLSFNTLQKRGLGITEGGWIQVEQTLQSLTHPSVFASGDCSSFVNPLPKSGVFALQEGPILAKNLERHVQNLPLINFTPNMEDLQFLNCGDGTAMGFAFGLVLRGEWVYQVKLAMDRRHYLSLTGDADCSNNYGHMYNSKTASPCRRNMEMLHRIDKLSTKQAAKMLTQININNYQESWAILERMSLDADYRLKVRKDYNCLASPGQRGSEKRQKKMHQNENESLPPPFHFLNRFLPQPAKRKS
jgi:selenide,water dikinase